MDLTKNKENFGTVSISPCQNSYHVYVIISTENLNLEPSRPNRVLN